MTTATNADRLAAAGWRRSRDTFRMITLPAEVADDELFYWRSPDGRVLTEASALQELEQSTKVKK